MKKLILLAIAASLVEYVTVAKADPLEDLFGGSESQATPQRNADKAQMQAEEHGFVPGGHARHSHRDYSGTNGQGHVHNICWHNHNIHGFGYVADSSHCVISLVYLPYNYCVI